MLLSETSSNFFSGFCICQNSETACFVKIIHKKKALLKVAFWNEDMPAIPACQSHRFEIDIESKWVCSHIKLSFSIRYVLIQVRTQFDMVANPL